MIIYKLWNVDGQGTEGIVGYLGKDARGPRILRLDMGYTDV